MKIYEEQHNSASIVEIEVDFKKIGKRGINGVQVIKFFKEENEFNKYKHIYSKIIKELVDSLEDNNELIIRKIN
jgi:hypothetical protein